VDDACPVIVTTAMHSKAHGSEHETPTEAARHANRRGVGSQAVRRDRNPLNARLLALQALHLPASWAADQDRRSKQQG
jgi:hypothetical protein